MIIKYFYLLLFFLTPLIFTSYNSELFELPKMYFVYGLTSIILVTHLFNYLKGRVPFFRRTFLDWPLGLFLASQVISTFFSIDVHTSLFGYYSRLNGGLLSLISFFILFRILVVYLDTKFQENIIKISLISGLLVAIYGILEHFGIDKDFWVQDVQARVFSTLGQPNWLAAYLCILLPFALDKFLHSTKKIHQSAYVTLIFIFYLCLLFTKSKSGLAAVAISLAIYLIVYIFQNIKQKNNIAKAAVIASFFVFLSLLINNPIKDQIFPEEINVNQNVRTDILITPSEDIRKIVWQGSLGLWKQYPIFGTGPETFAYSYYWTRPASHNLTSEWDFLYNKAHNEYLNYLATTGTFGFLSYIFLIISIVVFLIRNLKLEIRNLAILTSFASILITNFAGFSVVITSLFFFLFPALSISSAPKYSSINLKIHKKILTFILLLISIIALSKTLFYYLADITYASAVSLDDNQKYSSALTQIKLSQNYRSNEPLYLIKQADLLAKLAITSTSKPQSETFTNQSLDLIAQATNISPFSLNMWKEKAQIYYYLSTIDAKYYFLALDALTKATYLAPTDAKSFFMLAEFYENIDKTDESIQNYNQAIQLKSNYDHALFNLGKIYLKQEKYDLAKDNFEKTLQIAPTNTDAKNYLAQIATQSAIKKK